jgi:hypothetical protein
MALRISHRGVAVANVVEAGFGCGQSAFPGDAFPDEVFRGKRSV